MISYFTSLKVHFPQQTISHVAVTYPVAHLRQGTQYPYRDITLQIYLQRTVPDIEGF